MFADKHKCRTCIGVFVAIALFALLLLAASLVLLLVRKKRAMYTFFRILVNFVQITAFLLLANYVWPSRFAYIIESIDMEWGVLVSTWTTEL